MGKIVAVANQKGGVGKTTSAVNLAAALGERENSVLLVDIDPQGNATSGLGINKREAAFSTYSLLVAEAEIGDITVKTAFKNVDLLPSNMDLAAAEIELAEMNERVFRLKQAISPAKPRYDYVLIDCPPSLGLITLNALTAASSVLVPIQCEYYALEGLSQLMGTVRQVKRMYNPTLELEGILLTMYDSRLNLTHQVVREVKKHFADKLYKTVIPRNVALSEAPSYGEPIQYYARTSKGATAYDALAAEFLGQQNREGARV